METESYRRIVMWKGEASRLRQRGHALRCARRSVSRRRGEQAAFLWPWEAALNAHARPRIAVPELGALSAGKSADSLGRVWDATC